MLTIASHGDNGEHRAARQGEQPMTTFDEREKGYERKFQQDQELAFKVKARRNKLLGLWAAKQLGLAGAAAEEYASELVQVDLEKPIVEDIIAKLAADFAQKHLKHNADRLRAELERCEAEAKKQLGGAS
jgi:hypothetical protein